MHRRHLLAIDLLVPMVVGAVILVGLLVHGGADAARPVTVAVGLGACAVLWARRRAPVLTLGLSGALVAVLFTISDGAGSVAVLAPAVALYSLALRRGRAHQLLAAAAAVVAVILADVLIDGRPTVLQTSGHVLLVAIPLLAAEAIRTHRSYLAVVLERFELAEEARERDAARRAEHERMRIARELHDVVAHTLTGINVQAAAAAEQLAGREQVGTLEAIERTSREAIAELRAIVGVLRDPDGSEAPRAPVPRIDNIGELIERARNTGLQITVSTHGEPPHRLSDATSLAAYRILQESLTNATRHGADATIAVDLGFEAHRLAITVENNATPSSEAEGGVGIIGMRERAAALGGSFDAGRVNGQFRVQAELPYEPAT